ncbi:DNA-binding domain-containing protein, AraC-type [Aequorivita sublithincola DSM 14238]|uniref:DNA-binding domain-containing protein, AraC-type n=1 Tax=Aequorivita sublithincola (strain DSM 14238 / LMG 21431 / ACAM 643 / 9-3) TaxID=746697 RepID=I3YYQ8_AEQSU|nr:nickel-binding protein [Aequorivita sublithincola]AFL82126.1 DNA-binding domain-containing protein, AraC-type [Aequorivita sublithincola DSM 14238]
MPLFMDFHDLPEGLTAKHVAEMHQADLDIEHKYNCRGLTYWCDEKRQTAFCLIDAPDKQAVIDLHQNSHGAIPQRIIEVNDTIVESFLGRIEDPEKSKNTSLNIINDPAFRTIMVVKIKNKTLRESQTNTLKAAIRGYTTSINTLTSQYNGRVVKQEAKTFLMSFKSITDAMNCGIKIQESHNCVITPDLAFKIGISAGIPVTEKEGIFEDTIKTSDYLCDIAKADITITTAVKDLYEGENQNKPLAESKIIRVLSSTEEEFITQLMDYTEKIWSNPETGVNNFEANLGYSKSKLYRTMMNLVSKSPNTFLREYRLNKALEILEKQNSNISEIAYQAGFSSPAYFSKCFYKKYGILPSNFHS